MLKKLLKYDLKYNYKVLIIFYVLSILSSILTRIFLNIENSTLLYIIGQIFSGTTIAMFFNIIINNIMRLWARFEKNFYKDESYLTHTLPIDKKTLYLSKIITTIITLTTSFIIILTSILIAYYSKDLLNIIKNTLLTLTNDYNITPILLAFIYILFLEILNIIQCGYTGLILGNNKNNLKIPFSLIYGFITYTIFQVIVLLTLFIIALFNKDILNLIFTNEMINIETTKTIIYTSIITYTAIIITNAYINIKLFQKGVNVD